MISKFLKSNMNKSTQFRFNSLISAKPSTPINKIQQQWRSSYTQQYLITRFNKVKEPIFFKKSLKMISKFLKNNMNKSTQFRFNSLISAKPSTPINKIQQQWRSSYTQQYLITRFNKVKEPIFFNSVAVLKQSRRSFSSGSGSGSAAATSKIGPLKWYLRMIDSRPIVTKSVTSSLIYAIADLTSQAITLPPSGSFDFIRTSRMAAFGLLILGPSQHVWFNFMSKIVPNRDIFSTFKKIFMGQAIFGPCIVSVFFSYDAALQGESGDEIIAKLKRDLLPTLASSLAYWPMCDFLTYKFVPVHLQPLINSSFAYVWTIYLTYMASLKVGAD